MSVHAFLEAREYWEKLQGVTPEARSSGWAAWHSWERPRGPLEQMQELELEAPGHRAGDSYPGNRYRGLCLPEAVCQAPWAPTSTSG